MSIKRYILATGYSGWGNSIVKDFLAVYYTDKGNTKNTNQDSMLVQCMETDQGEVLFAAVCDGMGGMEKGELASATVVLELSDWFRQYFAIKKLAWKEDEIRQQWQELLEKVNTKLILYGGEKHIQLGTTVTAILIFPFGKYQFLHIGDTRIYQLNNEIVQLTEDHTYVARELKRGNMTAKQALEDSRRNVLLQCIGVNKYFQPQMGTGNLENNEGLLLCSDGFRHMVTEKELLEALQPEKNVEEKHMKETLVWLTECNKQRKETDNISAIYIQKR